MGDDSVMFCYENGVGMAWNPKGHDPSVNLKNPTSGLTNAKSIFKNGILSCKFRRNKVTNIDIPNSLSQNDCQTFDLRLLEGVRLIQMITKVHFGLYHLFSFTMNNYNI